MSSTREKIARYIDGCGHSPTVREIAQEVGRSVSTVHRHLDWLEDEGRIRRLGEQRRIYPAKAA